jgi:hypothetical protein
MYFALNRNCSARAWLCLRSCLMKYKRNADAARRAALEELAAYDQELGL